MVLLIHYNILLPTLSTALYQPRTLAFSPSLFLLLTIKLSPSHLQTLLLISRLQNYIDGD